MLLVAVIIGAKTLSDWVFSCADFGPESKGLDTKTAELFDSLRFVAFGLIPVRIRLRKEWDSNPRNSISRSPDFESGPFDHSGIFPWLMLQK